MAHTNPDPSTFISAQDRRLLQQLDLPELPTPPDAADTTVTLYPDGSGRLHLQPTCVPPHNPTTNRRTPHTASLHDAAPLLCLRCVTPNLAGTTPQHCTQLKAHAATAQKWLGLNNTINTLTDDVVNHNQHTLLRNLTTLSRTLTTIVAELEPSEPEEPTDHHTALQQALPATFDQLDAIRQTLHQLRNRQRHLQTLVVSTTLKHKHDHDHPQRTDRDRRQADLQLLAQLQDPTRLDGLRHALLLAFHTALQTTDDLQLHIGNLTAFRNMVRPETEPDPRNLPDSADPGTDSRQVHNIMRTFAQQWLNHTHEAVQADSRPRLVLTTNPPENLRVLLHRPIRDLLHPQLFDVLHPVEAEWIHARNGTDCGPAPDWFLRMPSDDQRHILNLTAATYQPNDIPHVVAAPRHLQAITNSLT